MALTAAYNWEPYLALMLVTATAVQFAAGDTVLVLGQQQRCHHRDVGQPQRVELMGQGKDDIAFR